MPIIGWSALSTWGSKMKTLALTAAITALAALPAMAETATETRTKTYDATTYGVIDGDGIEAATVRETTTATTGTNSASVSNVTTVDTADYNRYFTDGGEPKYMKSYSFNLE